MERAILVRHAESVINVDGIVNGDPSLPYPLTERGREQARALGRAVAEDPIDLCAVSEFPRAKETADIALEGRAIPRLTMADLNDIRPGELEGARLTAVRNWLREHGVAAIPPGSGESRLDTMRRYGRAFRSIGARPERVIMIVAHGLPVTVARVLSQGGQVPVSLEGLPPGHADPVRMTAAELANVSDGIDGWVRAQGPA